MAWNKQVVRTKVILEVNFRKYFLADVYRRNCSCAPVLRFFSVASDGAIAERSEPHFLVNFVPV